jgi:Na+-translocating ferredoxin:NAD+ oxidoreductase RnfG subunit
MEYVGIVLAAMILVSALVVSFTPVGQKIEIALCEARGGDCSELYPGASDDDPPDIECVQQSIEAEITVGASVAIVDKGSKVGMLTEVLADGRYRVTLIDGDNVGVSTGTGKIQAEISIGGKGGKAGAGASAGAGVELVTGTEYIFDSEEAVFEFYRWAAEEQSEDMIESSFGPIAGWGAKQVRKTVDKVSGNSYSPPEPSAHYVEGGVYIDANGMAGHAFFQGADAKLSVSDTIGVRKDAETDETTVYAKFSADGSAAYDLGFKEVAGASGEVEMVFAMTFDSSGELVSLGMDGVLDGAAFRDLNNVLGVPNDWAIGSDGWRDGSASAGYQYSMSLPVTDDNRTQVSEALNGIGVIKGIKDGTGPAAPLQWLARETVKNGDVVVQDIDVSNQDVASAGLAVELPLVKGAGVSGNASIKTTVVNNTSYLGRYGWNEWTGCW